MSTGSTNGAINFRSWRNAAGHKPELNPTTPSLLFPTIFLLPSLGFANFPRLHFHIITTQSHLSQTLDPNQHTIQNTPNPKIAPNLPPPPPPPPPLLFKISTLKKKTHKVLQFEKFVPKTEEIRWKNSNPGHKIGEKQISIARSHGGDTKVRIDHLGQAAFFQQKISVHPPSKMSALRDWTNIGNGLKEADQFKSNQMKYIFIYYKYMIIISI